MTGKIGNVPNFYERYCNDTVHKKPMVIAETSSMYLPKVKKGDSDYVIKSNWWQQVREEGSWELVLQDGRPTI